MDFIVVPPGMDNSGFHKAYHNFTEMLGESCLAVMCSMSEEMHKFFIQNSKKNFIYQDIYSGMRVRKYKSEKYKQAISFLTSACSQTVLHDILS